MDKLHRIADLQRLLGSRRMPVPLRRIMDQLGVSESTARRLLYSYRDDFGAPLVFDRNAGGWRLEPDAGGDHPELLPGFWFKPDEIHALLSAHDLLRQLQPSLLGPEIAPVTERIEAILAGRGVERSELPRRIRLIRSAVREPLPDAFALVARAVLTRRILRFGYRARSEPADEPPTRTRLVSPQRLIWYRSNWYLAAWCHGARAFRLFAVERIASPRIDDTPAREMSDAELDALAASGYGIFAGPATGSAVVRFSPRRARWVAEETWHPDQKSRRLPDGSHELEIPYTDPRELLMDCLRLGPDAEILSPPELREAARRLLAEALALYR